MEEEGAERLYFAKEIGNWGKKEDEILTSFFFSGVFLSNNVSSTRHFLNGVVPFLRT